MNSNITKENRTLYHVWFYTQDTGCKIDAYFLADSIAQIEENVADIEKIKVIKEVIDL